MANYNTFIVVDCKSNKNILTTSSARKSFNLLKTGVRVDVWNNNQLIEKIYEKNRDASKPYIRNEKDYIAKKQKRAEERNKRRRAKLMSRVNKDAS